MQLGWIDFSKEDRDKVHDVMNLLQEQGAVDELGIGLVRDAFANYFFPGTSTVQTRAKYFLIVPYVLKEAADGKYGSNLSTVLKRIDDEERDCGKRLYAKHNGSSNIGIIGARVLPRGWVARRPSSIYWNGIRTYGIFAQDDMSITEMVKLSIFLRKQENSMKLGNRKDDAEEGDKDDKNAGKEYAGRFFELPENHSEDWRENLSIELTAEEAVFLRGRIEHSVPGTLITYLLKNNIDLTKYDSFEVLYEELQERVPEEMAHMMKLACDFNRIVYAARVRYNMILSDGMNPDANEAWNWICENISRITAIDLEDVFQSLSIVNFKLRRFLASMIAALKGKKFELLDEIIIKREIELKTRSRAKLLHKEDYDPNKWVGGGWLDYRFSDAKQIILDIYHGEEGIHVSNE